MPIYHNTPSLVRETTATVGTGNYTLLGAAVGFRSFQSAITPDTYAYVPYVCKARDSTAFEVGIGKLTAANTLVRVSIVESSNGNAAVDWTAGTKDIYVGSGGSSAVGRHYVQADLDSAVFTVFPFADGFDEDVTGGFSFGSMVQHPLGASSDDGGGVGLSRNGVGVWICAGLASGNSGNAWVFVPPSAQPVHRDDGTGTIRGAVSFGALSKAANTDAGGWGFVVGESAHLENPATFYEGGPWDQGSEPGESQTGSRMQSVRTTDATPAVCGYYGDPFLLGEKQASNITIEVVAFDNAGPNAASWTLKGLFYRQDGGAAVLVGTVAKTANAATAGAAAWDVAVTASGNGVSVEVTGAAATTIQWSARIAAVQGAVVA